MKKTLLVGYYGKGNLGDEIILRQIAKKEENLTVLSANPEKTKKEHRIDSIKRPKNKIFSLTSFVKTLIKFDKIILGGGGLIFDEKRKIVTKNARYYLFFPLAGKILRKEVHIYKIGMGPIFSPLTKTLIKISLKNLENISVRDRESYELLKSLKIKSRIQKDPVEEINLKDKKNIYNLLIIRKLPSFMREKGFEEKLTKIINNIKNREIVVAVIDPKDEFLLKKIKTKKVLIQDIDMLFEYIEKSKKIVSMRLHPLILGKSAKKEIIGINCDPKIKSFVKNKKRIIELKEVEKISSMFNE